MSPAGLADRAVLVTGAAHGIGAATAMAMAARGASLHLLDLDAEPLADIVAQIEARGGVASGVACDVRDWDAVEAAAAACVSRYGSLDFAVANAALVEEGAFPDSAPERYRDVVETNLIGTINTVRAVAPIMRDAGSGHIVLMASVSGRETYVGQPVYIATKWGIVGFGKALRKELLSSGIRVTLIEPGLTDTDMARSSPLGREFLSEIEALSPEDVARVIVFAIEQPADVAVNEIVVQPARQSI